MASSNICSNAGSDPANATANVYTVETGDDATSSGEDGEPPELSKGTQGILQSLASIAHTFVEQEFAESTDEE